MVVVIGCYTVFLLLFFLSALVLFGGQVRLGVSRLSKGAALGQGSEADYGPHLLQEKVLKGKRETKL